MLAKAANTAAPTKEATGTTTTTTITSDPGILCFHHCNVKVFCFKLPHICPNCKVELDNVETTAETSSNGTSTTSNSLNIVDSPGGTLNNGYICLSKKLLPFRLPYPFVRATQYPCAIVLRPTNGDFLNDYNNATDLHIAVTTSTGCIVEFDRNGLRRHQRVAAETMPEWWQCLLVGDVPEAWYDYWDEVLFAHCNEQPKRWSIPSYHEDTHNCYTFVLAFLQTLAYDKLSSAAHSKTAFCEKYIVPRTTTAGKYISLYRKLRVAGIYVHHQQQQQRQRQHLMKSINQNNTKVRIGNAAGTKATDAFTPVHVNAMNNGNGNTKSSSVSGTHSIIATRAHTLCTIEE